MDNDDTDIDLSFAPSSSRDTSRRLSFYGTNRRSSSFGRFSSRSGVTRSENEENISGEQLLHQDVDSIIESLDRNNDESEQDAVPAETDNESMYTFQPTQPLMSSSAFNARSNQQHSLVSNQNNQSPDILCLLQQQQKLLAQVLSEQKEIKEAQKNFNKRVSTMELQISTVEESVTSSSSSPSPSSSKQRRRITRDLTTKVSKVHENLKDQFKPFESSTSNYNKEVKKTIIREVSGASTFSEKEITVAVQRKYESLRRMWVAEGKDDFEMTSKMESIRKKNRQRRQRKFDSRKCMVKKEEMKYWEQLSLSFMTEESDDESDPNCIVEHRLSWRSKDLEEFISRLDSRYQKKVSREGGTVAKKVRRAGEPSTSTPPVDAPAWTIRDNI